ncbi:MAG TPA: DUF2961 domain-containing protein [Candidatus Hydrogenedentes bacterium]|nr:DUF2961 domain-containing protein [Candidatus Hydrogenedentota bacterium]
MSWISGDHLARITSGRSRRESTWERNGCNDDCWRIEPGQTAVLADISGAGMITHIYFTIIEPNPLDYRDAVIRMYWDGEEAPSVEAPFGDFFCISNCTLRLFTSLMVAINPGCGLPRVNNGINCYFPMPFQNGARIELVNQSARVFGGTLGRVWCHVDYESYPDGKLPHDLGRFHAQWRRECLTTVYDAPILKDRGAFPRINDTGKDNYVMLEAKGEGHIVGLHLQVNNIQGGWYGEGDDMIFIDGDTWPPSIHGTGSEEVFGGGACPATEYAGPYTGFHLIENKGGDTFRGMNAMYRWYLNDPIRFGESIRMTIEHGHANDFENDYSSVVYWYQKEPHAPFPVLPSLAERRPILPRMQYEALAAYAACMEVLLEYQESFVFQSIPTPAWLEEIKKRISGGYAAMHNGDHFQAKVMWESALAIASQHRGVPAIKAEPVAPAGMQD